MHMINQSRPIASLSCGGGVRRGSASSTDAACVRPPRHTPRAFINALLALILLLLFASPALAQSINVSASLASDRVFVGDDIQYHIIVENSRDVTPPTIAAPPGLTIEYAGASDQPAPTMMVNGRRLDTGPDRYILIYRVSASAPGIYTIPSQTVRIAGQDRTLAPVRLTVALPPEDSSSILEATLSSSTAYVGEPITLTLHWYFAASVHDVRFTSSVTDTAAASTRAYDILPAADPRPVGQRPRNATFLETTFDAQTMACTVTERVVHNGREWGLVTAKRTIIPTQTGPLTIGPFAAIAQVQTGERNNGMVFTQPIIERRIRTSNAIALDVRPLPTQGRPANFTGLVGEFSIAASATPTELAVGDPIDLTVRISGPEPLDRLAAPDLSRSAAFTSAFRLSADGLRQSPTQSASSRSYSTMLRATSDRVTAVPPIELAYFDPKAGEYRIARSEPIPLTVRPTRQVTAGDAIREATDPEHAGDRRTPSLPLPAAEPTGPVLSAAPGLRANSTSIAALQNEHADLRTLLTQPIWAAGVVLPPLTFAAAGAYLLARRASPTPARRKADATRRALAMLRSSHAQVAPALRAYIATRFSVPEAAVTSYDAHALLSAEPSDLRDAFATLLDQADAARLSNSPPPPPSDAITILRRLQSEGAR